MFAPGERGFEFPVAFARSKQDADIACADSAGDAAVAVAHGGARRQEPRDFRGCDLRAGLRRLSDHDPERLIGTGGGFSVNREAI